MRLSCAVDDDETQADILFIEVDVTEGEKLSSSGDDDAVKVFTPLTVRNALNVALLLSAALPELL